MRYGYYIKIDKSFNLTDALALLDGQKYEDVHYFTGVYNTFKPLNERDYLVLHDGIHRPEYYDSDDLQNFIKRHKRWKWTELKLNYKDLGEI